MLLFLLQILRWCVVWLGILFAVLYVMLEYIAYLLCFRLNCLETTLTAQVRFIRCKSIKFHMKELQMGRYAHTIYLITDHDHPKTKLM